MSHELSKEQQALWVARMLLVILHALCYICSRKTPMPFLCKGLIICSMSGVAYRDSMALILGIVLP